MTGPSPISEAWASVRAVRVPFVAVQIALLAVALAYALSPGFRTSLVGLAEFRARAGWPFAAAGMLVAGLVVPEAGRRLARLEPEVTSGRLLALYAVYFGALGAIIGELQNAMARALGDTQGLAGVASRVALDLLVFTPLVAMPVATVVFAWRDAEFRAAGVGAMARSGDLTRRYVRLLVSCWLFWLPALVAVYAVPLLLQFPFVLIAEAAWALIVLALQRREAGRIAGVPA